MTRGEGPTRLTDEEGVVHAYPSDDPDPECYGCLGTGLIQWAGIKPQRCSCLDFCEVHERACERDPDTGKVLL